MTSFRVAASAGARLVFCGALLLGLLLVCALLIQLITPFLQLGWAVSADSACAF